MIIATAPGVTRGNFPAGDQLAESLQVRLTSSRPWQPALVQNALWVACGQVLRLGTQIVYFILIARSLGAHEYGVYVGVLAVVAIAAPFASLGSGNLLIKHVARNPPTFARYWGKALVTTLLTGTILLGVITIVARVWLPSSIPLRLVLAIGAADLLFTRLVDVSAQAYQAHQRLSRTALLQLLLSPLRLVAAAALSAVSTAPTSLEWGTLYLASALVGAAFAVSLVNRELGKPEFPVRQLGSELREGAFFAVTLSAQTSTNDIDKAMLARLSTLEATGVYAAAYRLVDAVFFPVGALLVAAYPRFFQHGVQGVRATARYARPLLSLGACYGVLTAMFLYFIAPVLPSILGKEYAQAVTTLRWLAVLPLLKTVHYFGADALTGAGYQGVRTLILMCIAATNVLLNLWLIPLHSWRGAAIATLISDGLLGVAIWAAIWYLGRHSSELERPDLPAVMKVG